jgi:peptidoglycan hydrolase-like protein with peptidoglycan-binding domain
VFGKETLKVVRAFQADQKLTVDGVVGHDTLARLDARMMMLDRELIQAAVDELNLRASLLLPGPARLFSATTARGAAPPGPPGAVARPTGQSTAAGVNLKGLIRGAH